MSLIVKCPNPECRKKYRLGEDSRGQRVKCQNCGEVFEAAEYKRAASGRAAPSQGPLQVQHLDGVTVVRLTVARINADNVESIGDALLSLAEDPASKKIVLNLACVEFLFSTALGKIVALEKKLQTHGGALRLCDLQPVVRDTLESAGLTILLDVYDEEEQALAGF